MARQTAVAVGLLQGEGQVVAALKHDAGKAWHSAFGVLALLLTVLVLGPLQSKGAQLCPAALSATASMAGRVISGYAAEVLVFGSSLHSLPVCGAAMLMLSSAILVLAKREVSQGKEGPRIRTEVIQDGLMDLAEPQRFVLDYLRAEDLATVTEMECQVMAGQNRLFMRCGISSEDCRMLCANPEDWLKTGCSLVMRDMKAEGAVVAFAVTEVLSLGFGKQGPAVKQLLAEKPRARFLWGGFFEAAMFRSPEFSVSSWLRGRTLRFTAGGTLAGYEGLGLQVRLRQRMLELAVQHGFHRIVVRVANPATEHVWKNKFGFQCLASMKCAELEFGGAKLAPDLDETISVYQKVLQRSLLRDPTPFEAFARLCLSAWRQDVALLARPSIRLPSDSKQRGQIDGISV